MVSQSGGRVSRHKGASALRREVCRRGAASRRVRRLPPMVRAGIAVVAVQPQRRLCRQQKNRRFFCPRRTCMAIRTSEGSPR
ncbi:hypothetical protein ACF3DV_29105 [Chlorogloeopsis fritschii PCC 9212]|uniref:hypothetical protein n=1 Tax=Chlorogloeopsis fritschii TaxID=1124 RepID=UPI000F8F3998|nr:hypothetical protein [Chlorogloeopsis fritschii]